MNSTRLKGGKLVLVRESSSLVFFIFQGMNLLSMISLSFSLSLVAFNFDIKLRETETGVVVFVFFSKNHSFRTFLSNIRVVQKDF